jgi:hypothetical protein
MTLKNSDMKKLWARSGNMCSFPKCQVELTQEERANRVIGEEEHIKGEKPTAPRYDPNQTQEERESYENRILLCPTHHTLVDSNEKTWTVSQLRKMKIDHEKQIIRNQQFPQVMNELKKLFQKYQVPEESFDFSITDVLEDSSRIITVRVDASHEEGTNTNILVHAGQKVAFFARGHISYDNGHNFATPEGIICSELGIPLFFKDENGMAGMAIWPHPRAYNTNISELGRIGSLIGWIDEYTEQDAFLIGSKREIQITKTGYLYLMVNDAKGSYDDNDGEFRVDIRISE